MSRCPDLHIIQAQSYLAFLSFCRLLDWLFSESVTYLNLLDNQWSQMLPGTLSSRQTSTRRTGFSGEHTQTAFMKLIINDLLGIPLIKHISSYTSIDCLKFLFTSNHFTSPLFFKYCLVLVENGLSLDWTCVQQAVVCSVHTSNVSYFT